MNNKKKIYIALAVLAIIILGIGIILNFTSNNEKQPAKSNSTAKYSSNDAIVELNKLYNLKGYSLNLVTETKEEYVFQVVMQNKTSIYKFNKNTGEVKTSTKFE